jgi:predicted dienelactone hydrolase
VKWIRRALVGLLLLIAVAMAAAFAVALKVPRPVGFQQVQVVGRDGHVLVMGVWYPTKEHPWPTTFAGLNLMEVAHDAPVAGQALPLVMISHGNGGGPFSHADLVLALAGQGFVVAAPMHEGDNFADQRAMASADWFVNRTREMRSAVDYMLASWPAHARIDSARIGIYGFSAGGFTALAAIGGVPDLRRLASHCASDAEFACRLLADAHSPLLDADKVPPASAYVHDPRIKAAVIAAPGLGFTFTPEGLASVIAPVQLWSGADDTSVPTKTNAGWVSDALGQRAELRIVPGAGHFSFLVPCGLIGPPLLCHDAAGFDRRQFHASMNRDVVAFFQSKLPG